MDVPCRSTAWVSAFKKELHLVNKISIATHSDGRGFCGVIQHFVHQNQRRLAQRTQEISQCAGPRSRRRFVTVTNKFISLGTAKLISHLPPQGVQSDAFRRDTRFARCEV